MALLGNGRNRPRVRPVWVRLLGALLAASLLALACQPARAQEFSAEEGRIKAGLLFNFAKFVAWPSKDSSQSKLQICVVGDPGVAAVLKTEAEGKSIGQRHVVVQELNPSSQFEGCQILFIDNHEKKAFEILERAKQLPIVTVGEDGRFLRRGGVINLVPEDGKLKFEINLDAATQAGLSINSKLLQLARMVIHRA